MTPVLTPAAAAGAGFAPLHGWAQLLAAMLVVVGVAVAALAVLAAGRAGRARSEWQEWLAGRSAGRREEWARARAADVDPAPAQAEDAPRLPGGRAGTGDVRSGSCTR